MHLSQLNTALMYFLNAVLDIALLLQTFIAQTLNRLNCALF